MKKYLKKFILALLCILCVQMVFTLFNQALAAPSLEPNSGGMFDNQILVEIHRFMLKTYRSMSQVLMVGHALMCYAVKVDYTCFGINSDWVKICFLKIPDLTYLLVGFLIYFTGILISMCLGMYFVDICFKIGFAIIFMPIAIALWPFPPTKNKFSENLGIIIRNSMLFMLLGIGVAYCVKLISEGLFEGGKEAFWDAIANGKSEELAESFSLFSSHIFVVLFALLYGFKILQGSVNNYLNTFFSDAAFGGESPMHHMGTQAVGMAYANTVKPAMSYAKDVATHQTGRAVSGLGSGLIKMSSAEGRQELKKGITGGYNRVMGRVNSAAQKTAHAIRNPREVYNNAMQKAAQSANKAVHNVGDAVKSIHDNVTAFAPTPGLRESWRQEQVSRFNQMVDKYADKIGNTTEKTIAHGGGALKDVVKHPVKNYNAAMQEAGAGINQAIHAGGTAVKKAYRAGIDAGVALGKDDAWREEKLTNFNAKVNAATDTVGAIAEIAVAKGGAGVKEVGKQTVAATGAAAINTMHAISGNPERTNTAAVREKLHQKHEAVNQAVDNIKADIREMREAASQPATPLQPESESTLTKPFKDVADPIGTVAKLANNAEALRESDHKVIIKKTGQVVFRALNSVKAGRQAAANKLADAIEKAPQKADDKIRQAAQSVSDTAHTAAQTTVGKGAKWVGEKTVGTLGKVLKGFGDNLADNSSHVKKKEKFDMNRWINQENYSDEAKEKMQEAAEREKYRQMGEN